MNALYYGSNQVPVPARPSGSLAFAAYSVFMSGQPGCPNGLSPVNRIRHQ
ncbi:hypothetical protein ACQEWB_39510 [Streptomyces sp. CA-249302]